MDIEQLKLVIETVKSVSGDAQSVAIWWLILDKLVPVVAWLLVGLGIYSAVNKLINAVKDDSDNERRIKELRDILHPNGSGYVCSSDYEIMLKKIRKINVSN